MVVPAVEIEIGEQENHERGGERHFGAGTPDLLIARRYLHQLVPEAEIHADIGQNGPCKRGGGREQRSSLDDEKDGQEQGQQT